MSKEVDSSSVQVVAQSDLIKHEIADVPSITVVTAYQSKPQNEKNDYLIVRQKKGEVRSFSDWNALPFFEKKLNKVVKWYLVKKDFFPVTLHLRLPSAQSTYRFVVQVEFQIKIQDPCEAVSQNVEDIVKCIYPDLKLAIARVLRQFNINQATQANAELQDRLEEFVSAPFLFYKPGMVDVAPDPEAKETLRKLERSGIDLEQGVRDRAKEIVIEKSGDLIEDHKVAEMVTSLTGGAKVLPSKD